MVVKKFYADLALFGVLMVKNILTIIDTDIFKTFAQFTLQKINLLVVCHIPDARFQSMESRQKCEEIVCCIIIGRTEVER